MPTRLTPSSTCLTQPAVPRTPVTMVEVRIFSFSSSFSGAVTLKNSSPLFSSSSRVFPLRRTSRLLDWSSFTAFSESRVIQA